MNCDNMRGCCSPCSQLAQQLEETNTRAVQAYNLAAQAFAAVIPPIGGSNIDVTLVSGPAYEIALKNPMDDDVVINADLTVNGDIYQNGSAYESHAEQLYTTKDTVIMRDGATTGLVPGDVAGLIMKKYDGTNDGALVVGNDGTARVGDVGSEQPLLTRDESNDMTDGAIVTWNATGNKAVAAASNIGGDTTPVKVVNGIVTAVTDELQTKLTVETRDIKAKLTAAGVSVGAATLYKWGKIGMIALTNLTVSSTIINIPVLESGEASIAATGIKMLGVNSGTYLGELYMSGANLMIEKFGPSGSYYGCFFFMFA